MGHPSELEIMVHGKGGHGSQPHDAVDPILTAAAIVVALQSVVSRSISYADSAVVSICTITGGETSNVIPDKCHMTGTIRDLDPEVFAVLKARIETVVRCTAEAHGATADCHILEQYPVVMNHATETAHVQRLWRAMVPGDEENPSVTEAGLPVLGAEDFSYYLHDRPGCFFFLGTRESVLRGLANYEGGVAGETQRSNCMCHNTAFDFNDNLLPVHMDSTLSIPEVMPCCSSLKYISWRCASGSRLWRIG